MTEIAIEEVQALIARVREINRIEFNEIEWTKDGKPMDIPENIREEFQFIGLSNVAFIEEEFFIPGRHE